MAVCLTLLGTAQCPYGLRGILSLKKLHTHTHTKKENNDANTKKKEEEKKKVSRVVLVDKEGRGRLEILADISS